MGKSYFFDFFGMQKKGTTSVIPFLIYLKYNYLR
jgi:hypothetical protein